MTGYAYTLDGQRLIDRDGVSSGGVVIFYYTGTSVLAPIYTDQALTIPAANPVVADASGLLPTIYLDTSITYRRYIIYADGETNNVDPLFSLQSALVSPTGASYVNYNEGQAGAVTRSVQSKLQDYVSVEDFGANTTGSVDARAAFVAADTAGPFTVTPGLYLINSNLTITNKVTFVPGARLVIPQGVTVTFSSAISAPQGQIFNFTGTGTGAVAGLVDVDVTWFNGDAWNNSARTDGRALTQRAYDACVLLAGGGSTVRWPGGYMKHDGAPILITKGQRTLGAGLGKTMILWTSATTNGFQISTVKNATIEGIGCSYSDASILPTSGIFINVVGGFLCSFKDIFCGIAYQGLVFSTGSASCNVSNIFIYECFSAGILITSSGDIYVNQFLITTGYTYLTLNVTSGTFVVGEHFTTGPAPATIAQINGTTYRVNGSTNFTVGSTLTGSTSGATATVTACQVPHALGGVRLTEHAEAIVFTDGDIIGGQFAMTTVATVNSNGVRPEYNKFTSVYFDSSIGGVDCQNSAEFDFVDCWFSGPGNQAGYFHNVDGFKFTGGQAYDAGGYGLVFEGTSAPATNIVVNGMSIRGNGTATANTYSGLLFKAGATKFNVSHCIGDDSGVGAGTQKYAVEIQAGASDLYSVSYNRFPSSKVSDGGTGSNKVVGNNF